MKKLFFQFIGFCGIGGATTLLSLFFIAFANEVLHCPALMSYISVYIVTLLLSYILNTKFVFKSAICIKKMLKYCVAYISGMVLGCLMLYGLMYAFSQVNATLLNFPVIFVTTVWNFIFVKKILNSEGKKNV